MAQNRERSSLDVIGNEEITAFDAGQCTRNK